MKTIRLLAALVSFSTFCGCGKECGCSTVSFRPGASEILIASNACSTVRLAAQDAQQFLSQSLGSEVPIVHAPTKGNTALVLGPNEWASAAGVTTNGLSRDAFRIRTVGSRVYVLGVDDEKVDAAAYRQRGGIWYQNFERATVFGVYGFLERFVGVRFYFPGDLGTIVPRRTAIEVPRTDLIDAPAMTVRRYTPYMNRPWYEGERAGELRHPMKTLNWWRLKMETQYMPCCHGSRALKYDLRFAKSHPEYFALLPNGQRDKEQLCHTSKIWDEFYEDAKSYLSGESASVREIPADNSLPGAKNRTFGWGVNCQRRELVDLMPEDGMIRCQCERCKAEWAKAPEIGWASPLIWGNVVRVANRLKKAGVPGRISMMAYSKYRPVPDFAFPDNVEVMVAERGPWTEADAAERARELKEISDWTKKIGKRVSLWNYVNKLGPSTDDIPNMAPRAIGRYYQTTAPMIYGAFLQNSCDRLLYDYLNCYVFAKVMWDPTIDVDAIIDEHHHLMFGAAAPEMKEFYDTLERLWITKTAGRTIDTSLGPQSEAASPYKLFFEIYTPEVIDRFEALFVSAAAKLGADSLEARRLKLIKREFLDPLVKRARAYVRETDVERGLKRDAESTSPNYVPDAAFAGEKGHLVAVRGKTVDRTCSLRLKDGSSLVPGKRYRLSYCIRTKNLVPDGVKGGAMGRVWAGMNFWLPGNAYNGTMKRIYQVHEFTAGPKTGEDGNPSMATIRISNCVSGEAWFDHVRVEEIK